MPRPIAFGVRRDEEAEGPPEKKIRLDNDAEPELPSRGAPSIKNEELPPEHLYSDNSDDVQSKPDSKELIIQTTLEPPAKTLPPTLSSLASTIRSTLQANFPNSPPHTAQRLAELLLHPTHHYRTLPSYLRAVDRIVSVASTASVFPLPTIKPNSMANGVLLNGIGSDPSSPNPGDDAAFIGGAELTEVPWIRASAEASSASMMASHNGAASDLRTESTSLIDGPHGAGSVETVVVNMNGGSSRNNMSVSGNSSSSSSSSNSSGTGGLSGVGVGNVAQEDVNTHPQGVTQGELLRQEQEAGIVPVPAQSTNRVTRSSAAASAAAARSVGLAPATTAGASATATAAAAATTSSDDAPNDDDDDVVVLADSPSEERVHARGPDTIGMEDMGPQAPGSGLEGGISVGGGASSAAPPQTDGSATSDTGLAVSNADADADAAGRNREQGATTAADDDVGNHTGNNDYGGEKGKEKEKLEGEGEGEGEREEDDFILVDADGVVEGDDGVAATTAAGRDESGADAVDSTAL